MASMEQHAARVQMYADSHGGKPYECIDPSDPIPLREWMQTTMRGILRVFPIVWRGEGAGWIPSPSTLPGAPYSETRANGHMYAEESIRFTGKQRFALLSDIPESDVDSMDPTPFHTQLRDLLVGCSSACTTNVHSNLPALGFGFPSIYPSDEDGFLGSIGPSERETLPGLNGFVQWLRAHCMAGVDPHPNSFQHMWNEPATRVRANLRICATSRLSQERPSELQEDHVPSPYYTRTVFAKRTHPFFGAVEFATRIPLGLCFPVPSILYPGKERLVPMHLCKFGKYNEFDSTPCYRAILKEFFVGKEDRWVSWTTGNSYRSHHDDPPSLASFHTTWSDGVPLEDRETNTKARVAKELSSQKAGSGFAFFYFLLQNEWDPVPGTEDEVMGQGNWNSADHFLDNSRWAPVLFVGYGTWMSVTPSISGRDLSTRIAKMEKALVKKQATDWSEKHVDSIMFDATYRWMSPRVDRHHPEAKPILPMEDAGPVQIVPKIASPERGEKKRSAPSLSEEEETESKDGDEPIAKSART